MIKECQVRYYLKHAYKGDRLVTIKLNDFNTNDPELVEFILKEHASPPMMCSGLKDIKGRIMFDKDYIRFNTDGGTSVVGIIKYVNERNHNGFRVVSLKNKLNTWLLSEFFVETNKPVVFGNKYLTNPSI